MKRPAYTGEAGFTLIELMIAVAIMGTLAAMAIPKTQAAIEQAKVAAAIEDVRTLQSEIIGFSSAAGTLPTALADIGRENLLDPWKRPYVYVDFASLGGGGASGKRKDRFLVPINSTYDLYSLGQDGKSKLPLLAPDSHDDIVRANDGGFIGLASNF